MIVLNIIYDGLQLMQNSLDKILLNHPGFNPGSTTKWLSKILLIKKELLFANYFSGIVPQTRIRGDNFSAILFARHLIMQKT
jgi:hypothetical protein